MATTVAYSTLLVLLAESNQDLWDLWYLNASYNDPGGDKHTWSVRDVLQAGNFRSALVDQWDQEAFEEVKVSAVNMYGDLFWYTDFDVTNISYSIPEWFTSSRITGSHAFFTISEKARSLADDVNYALRTNPALPSTKTFFLVTRGNYNYHRNMPRIFVTKSQMSGFTAPLMVEGRQGCFPDSSFTVSTSNNYVDNSPYRCVSVCIATGGTYDAAMLKSTECICGTFSSGPTSDESKCQDPCPGNSSYTCGSTNAPNHGDVYHIPVSSLPGSVSPELVESFTSTSNPYEVQFASTFATAYYVTGVHVTALVAGDPFHGSYTFNYSIKSCSSPKWTEFNFPNATNIEEPAELPTSTDIPVDVLIIKCFVVTLHASVTFVNVTIFRQDASLNTQASALIIQGMKTVPVTTSTTSTAAPTTTTTTATTTTTTTPIPTTTTTAVPTTTTAVPTTTTTVAPTTTTTTVAATTTTTGSPPPTTTAGVTTSQGSGTTSSSSVTNSTSPHCLRLCECTDAQQVVYNEQQLLERIHEIQNTLRLDVLDLSSTRRKRTSAEDKRPMAVGIGYVGVAILVAMFSFCLLMDAGRIWSCMKILKGNL